MGLARRICGEPGESHPGREGNGLLANQLWLLRRQRHQSRERRVSEDSERVENFVTSGALTFQSHRVESHGAPGDHPPASEYSTMVHATPRLPPQSNSEAPDTSSTTKFAAVSESTVLTGIPSPDAHATSAPTAARATALISAGKKRSTRSALTFTA